jgi:hypothetical protein
MPYCIHCGTQYTNPGRFCMHCGKALPASASSSFQTLLKPATGSPKQVRNIMYALTGLVIVLAIFSIIAGSNKEPVKESKKKKFSDYDRGDKATVDSVVAVVPPASIDTAMVGPVEIPAEEPLRVENDTLTAEPDKPAPSYVDPAYNNLVFTSPCYVIITGFYTDPEMARKEASKLIRKGYRAAFLHTSNFPVFNNSQYYATVVGPYETASECWNGLRSLRKIGPHWYGVKLTYDSYDRVELKP